MHEEAITNFNVISVGVLQGSVLEPILYLIYATNIQTNCDSMKTMFDDHAQILATSSDQKTTTEYIQTSINSSSKIEQGEGKLRSSMISR